MNFWRTLTLRQFGLAYPPKNTNIGRSARTCLNNPHDTATYTAAMGLLCFAKL